MYRFPALSRAACVGNERLASVARPVSPHLDGGGGQKVPLPAIVVIIFVEASTLRTRKLLVSAMYMFPDLSNTTELGPFKVAFVAGPPSPLKPALPVPATVETAPPLVKTRIRLLAWSAK